MVKPVRNNKIQRKIANKLKDDDRIFYAAISKDGTHACIGEAYCERQRIRGREMMLVKIIEMGTETYIEPKDIAKTAYPTQDYEIALGWTKAEAVEKLKEPLLERKKRFERESSKIDKILETIEEEKQRASI